MSKNKDLTNYRNSVISRPDDPLTDAELASAAEYVGVDLSGSLDELAAKAKAANETSITLAQHAMRSAFGAGLYLLICKQQSVHGTWLSYLEEIGFPRQRASELMRAATALAKTSPKDRDALLGMGYRQMRVVAQYPEEFVEAVEAGEASRLVPLGATKLAQELLKARKENTRLKDETVRLQKSIKEGDELSPEARGFEFACGEILAIQHRVHTEYALLQQTHDALLAPKTKDTADIWRLDAAQVWYAALGSLVATPVEMREALERRFGPAVANPNGDLRISRQAAAEFVKRKEQLEADVREAAGKRVQARHKGRGRPAKTLEAGLRQVTNSSAED